MDPRELKDPLDPLEQMEPRELKGLPALRVVLRALLAHKVTQAPLAQWGLLEQMALLEQMDRMDQMVRMEQRELKDLQDPLA